MFEKVLNVIGPSLFPVHGGGSEKIDTRKRFVPKYIPYYLRHKVDPLLDTLNGLKGFLGSGQILQVFPKYKYGHFCPRTVALGKKIKSFSTRHNSESPMGRT